MKSTSSHSIFKNVQLVDLSSKENGQIKDVEVIDGKIARIELGISSENAEVIEGKGYSISPGLFDMQVSCGEPGEEEKETFQSLSSAALAGGISGLLLMPNSNPVTDNRGQVEFIKNNASRYPIHIYPSGSISIGKKGEQLAELADLFDAGAIAFTDDKSPIGNSVLVHLAMQYNRISGGVLCFHAEDAMMSLGGKVNEGLVSVQLGMKGQPSIAEELGIVRLLTLAKYHQAKIHIQGISSKSAVELIRNAKNEGLDVSCSVYAHQLFFTDEALINFESHFKVWPPLRSELDRNTLRAGVIDGTIDVICSDHRPQTLENKEVEFDYAKSGVIGVETLFGAANASLENIPLETLIERMSSAPRKILGLNIPSIEIGKEADFFLYDPKATFQYDVSSILSKSVNTPFGGQVLKGKIKGTFVNSEWFQTEA